MVLVQQIRPWVAGPVVCWIRLQDNARHANGSADVSRFDSLHHGLLWCRVDVGYALRVSLAVNRLTVYRRT